MLPQSHQDTTKHEGKAVNDLRGEIFEFYNDLYG